MKAFWAALLLGAATIPSASAAQQSTINQTIAGTRLDVSAAGYVTRAPDLATISAGVVSHAATATSAIQQTATRMARVRETLPALFDAAGVAATGLTHGLTLNRASMLIDAAVDGQGIVLARTTLSAWDILNGRLVRPFAPSLRLSKTYWIICPKATASFAKRTSERLAQKPSTRPSAPPTAESTRPSISSC